MKTVYYLPDGPVIQKDTYEIITWVYRWNGEFQFSQALRELIGEYYWYN